jgi:hypothetical protein
LTERFSTGRLLGTTFTLLRRGAPRAASAFVAMAALGIVIDSGAVDQTNANALNMVASGVTVAAGYWITKALLEDLADRRLPARFPAFFGLSLLSGLGILLGMVVLVVPGIILFIRWSLANPILLGGDESVTEAMQHSWRATGLHFWPILVAFLALYGPTLALVFAAFWLDSPSPGGIIPVVLTNFVLNAGLIAGWHAAVAIYALLEAPARLAETFA